MNRNDLRRYRYQAGRYLKVWDGRNDGGWYRTKAEALAAVQPAKAESPKEPAKGDGGIDWSTPWLKLRASLREMGFDGATKAEAIEFAKAKGWDVPE